MLEILRNIPKNIKNIQIIVFKIETHIRSFIAKLLNNKLEKTVRINIKILTKQSVFF